MIVVVGHGRSPEGRGWGKYIDRHVVVRMWDWDWQPCDDYGERYDHGLLVMTPKGLRIFQQNNKRQPSVSWLIYPGKPVTEPLQLMPLAVMVDTSRYCEEARALGGAGLDSSKPLTLTRGTAAACWAIEQATFIGMAAVILVGFDNVRAGVNRPIDESFCPAYWAQYMSRFAPDTEKVYPIGGSKTATHDMAVELPLLQALAKKNWIHLAFAEDTWR